MLLLLFSILREVEFILKDFDHIFMHRKASLVLLHVCILTIFSNFGVDWATWLNICEVRYLLLVSYHTMLVSFISRIDCNFSKAEILLIFFGFDIISKSCLSLARIGYHKLENILILSSQSL
jgi:hypothetical protein